MQHEKPAEDQQGLHQALKRFYRQTDLSIQSPGEYILPFFLAATEACWLSGLLIGLAGVDFLGSTRAVLPFWGVALPLLAAVWLFQRATLPSPVQTGAGPDRDSGLLTQGAELLFFGGVALLTLVLIWSSLYSAQSLFDPAWLVSFGENALALNVSFYQALFIIAVVVYLCWRGARVSALSIEPAEVFRQLWTGLVVFVLAIVVRAGRADTSNSSDNIVLLLLLPIFLYLVLSAHSLARTTFVRREHPVGQDGSAVAQERAMLSIIALVGTILLALTLLGGIFLSPTFFRGLQPLWNGLQTAYGWLTGALSAALTFLLYPFFWLFNLWFASHPTSPVTIKSFKNTQQQQPVARVTIPPSFTNGLTIVAHLLLPLLLLLIIVFLMRMIMRRRRRVRTRRQRKSGEVHESVWSWALFWQQLRGFWRALFGRLVAASENAEQQEASEESEPVRPAARSIRELYRELLKKSASLGYRRGRTETAREFQHRLDEQLLASEPQLDNLTSAYVMVRYGGHEPEEDELQRARQSWSELEQKWQTPQA
jgi:hypothetical protein